MEANSPSAWNSTTGKAARWILYIPFGIGLLVLIQGLAYAFFAWLFRDAKGFFIVGVLLGGAATIPAAAYLYYFAFHAIAGVCPSPKPGMVVFGTLYALFVVANIFRINTSQDYDNPISLTAWFIACSLVGIKALVDIWNNPDH